MEKMYKVNASVNVNYKFKISDVAKTTEEAKLIALENIYNGLGSIIDINDYKIETINVVEEETETEIMTEFNGHNVDLVKQINIVYNQDKKQFHLILSALIERDKEECEEFDILSYSEEDDKAHLYLMEVADDNDLKTIISFFN